jgi:hypothetical protein
VVCCRAFCSAQWGTFKRGADLKPHRFRYWLTPKRDPAFDSKCADICEVHEAAGGADGTHRMVSTDEMTGIQALECIAPGLTMGPCKVERREFEYRRHGTQRLSQNESLISARLHRTSKRVAELIKPQL